MDRKKNMSEPSVTLAAVGDVMLDNEMSRIIERRGPDFPFLNIVSALRDADLVFGNLETPLTTCQERVIWDFSKLGWKGKSKPFFLKGPPMAAVGLKNAGFNVLSIANNHIMDYGTKGASETVAVLRKNGIIPVGFGMNAREAMAPKLLEAKGIRFAFLAGSSAYEATFFSPGAAPVGLWSLKKQVKKARKISDVTIVSLHVGEEFNESPSPLTVRLARGLIETGANVVLCHHPHTLQRIETYEKGLIAYSLGNFVFDYGGFLDYTTKENAERCRQSIILKCTISKYGIINHSIIPVQLDNNFQPTMISRTSRLGKVIAATVRAPPLPSYSGLDRRESQSARKEVIKALIGLTVNLRRKDFKSIYILIRKMLDRLYARRLTG